MSSDPKAVPFGDDGPGDALRYGAGLPRVGLRALGEDERRAIERRVKRASARGASLVGCVAASWAAGASVSSVIAAEFVDAVGGPLGLAACASGAFGACAALLGARRPWRLASAAGLVYLLVVASLGPLAPEMRLPSDRLTWAVVVVTVLLGNGYLTLRLVHGIRLLRRRSLIRLDLETAQVEQYAGRWTTRFMDDALRRSAVDGSLDDLADLDVHRLELLPASGLVLRVDGRALPHVELAHVTEVAPTMPHALRVALPDGIAPSQSSASLDLRRRSLTPAEREELARHTRRLRRGYLGPAAAMAATVLVVVSKLWPAFEPAGLLDVSALLWYGLTVVMAISYGRRLLAARKLEADRKLRWVVTVEDQRSHDGTPPKLEVLAVSELAWTENASPAGWRVSRI